MTYLPVTHVRSAVRFGDLSLLYHVLFTRSMTRENGGILGVRIHPTCEGNMQMGLDVLSWIEMGVVDYLMPCGVPRTYHACYLCVCMSTCLCVSVFLDYSLYVVEYHERHTLTHFSLSLSLSLSLSMSVPLPLPPLRLHA